MGMFPTTVEQRLDLSRPVISTDWVTVFAARFRPTAVGAWRAWVTFSARPDPGTTGEVRVVSTVNGAVTAPIVVDRLTPQEFVPPFTVSDGAETTVEVQARRSAGGGGLLVSAAAVTVQSPH